MKEFELPEPLCSIGGATITIHKPLPLPLTNLYTSSQVMEAVRQERERCAKIAEQATARIRWAAGVANAQPIKPCVIAAAIRGQAEGRE